MTKEIKNIKISPESHELLKKYCEKRGMKIYKFLENLIVEKCKEKKDIYGEGERVSETERESEGKREREREYETERERE